MRTAVECLPCFLRQAARVARVAGCAAPVREKVVQTVAGLIATMDLNSSPPANAEDIYAAIHRESGCADPYADIKKRSNEQALAVVAGIEAEFGGRPLPLATALRLAIAGNAIDYGAFAASEIASTLATSRTATLAVDHSDLLQRRLDGLRAGDKVLYLADNCGEIVYDRLLVAHLASRGLAVTVAVKDGPIINDALVEDAQAAGLDRFAALVSNGSRCPGTVLERCSPQFRRLFDSAELVLAKGQGNFESLSQPGREVFFLLLLKCRVAAVHMATLLGRHPDDLLGRGEMAVYCSTESIKRGTP